jgi:hypothetical protein
MLVRPAEYPDVPLKKPSLFRLSVHTKTLDENSRLMVFFGLFVFYIYIREGLTAHGLQ